MDFAIFPPEIFEHIGQMDEFVAYNIASTCRDLYYLKWPTKPPKTRNVYKQWRCNQITRIVSELADGQPVDYFRIGDWIIHNYYNTPPDEYMKIEIFNHRLKIWSIHTVEKTRNLYFDKNTGNTILKMAPTIFKSVCGFDYIYNVCRDFNGFDDLNDHKCINYQLHISIRPISQLTSWYEIKF